MNSIDILLERNLVEFDFKATSSMELSQNSNALLGTLVSNLLYYGYVPAQNLYKQLGLALIEDKKKVTQWWNTLEKALKRRTRADKNIGEYIVYQNFPKEVLEMSEAEYWIRQLSIYWGVAPTLLQKEKEERSKMFEAINFKVLQLAQPNALESIWESLLNTPAGWTVQDKKEIKWFLDKQLAPKNAAFKENLVYLATLCIKKGIHLKLATTTDVLRLATGLSDGDISLNSNSKFKLKRSERKYILSLLEKPNDLGEGIMRHKNKWIKLFHQLHVGDYAERFPKSYKVATTIRNNGKFPTFNAKVENYLEQLDQQILVLLQERPGEFARRLLHMVELFEQKAVDHFLPIVDQLETITIVKLKKHIKTVSNRKFRTFAPKANWRKLQIVDNEISIDQDYAHQLVLAFDTVLKERLVAKFGDQIFYTEDIDKIKLPSNNAEAISRFNKGTVLDIPEDIKFIRTATYWQEKDRVCWMDNGWNFFDEHWLPKGTTCWNNVAEMGKAAVFSGDPVNSYNKEGKAGQLIDLYIPQLLKQNVRYAVWSILSYNRIPFEDMIDVQGLMLMGTDAQKGKLIEPSRVTFAFPVKGKSLAKYICYVDLLLRKIIILDTGLYAQVSSAKNNEAQLSTQMPAVVEHINSLPSILDLVGVLPSSEMENAIPIVYTDKEVEIIDKKAFVFEPKNDKNQFTPLSIEDFLSI
ncbi:MAG: hypothetical protein GY810_18410 [Aureispira sp.]|nr:hypothetical protein [Aureispira sp.]